MCGSKGHTTRVAISHGLTHRIIIIVGSRNDPLQHKCSDAKSPVGSLNLSLSQTSYKTAPPLLCLENQVSVCLVITWGCGEGKMRYWGESTLEEVRLSMRGWWWWFSYYFCTGRILRRIPQMWSSPRMGFLGRGPASRWG